MGVDLERFRRIDRDEARRRLGLDPGGRYLLFPADPSRPEKRHDLASRLALAVDAQLLAYENTDPDDVPLWINAASVVVVTSDREGFGLAALEALACEVPVVATPAGVAPLALAGIDGTLCAPFDVERWADLVRAHLESGDPRVDGRARAALFGRDRMAERVLQAYGELVPPASPV
jgi:hypothetical protein